MWDVGGAESYVEGGSQDPDNLTDDYERPGEDLSFVEGMLAPDGTFAWEPDSPSDVAEEELAEHTYWTEEEAEENVPDNTWESVQAAGEGAGMAVDDATDAVNVAVDVATDPVGAIFDEIPGWAPYAAAGIGVLLLLVVLRPYAQIGAEVAG